MPIALDRFGDTVPVGIGQHLTRHTFQLRIGIDHAKQPLAPSDYFAT